jgi:hypothetical protein
LIALIAFNLDIGALSRTGHFAESLVETRPMGPAARQLIEEIKHSGS